MEGRTKQTLLTWISDQWSFFQIAKVVSGREGKKTKVLTDLSKEFYWGTEYATAGTQYNSCKGV